MIAELYFHTSEEGLEVETPTADPTAVTLVGCPVEREGIRGNSCDSCQYCSSAQLESQCVRILGCFGLWFSS